MNSAHQVPGAGFAVPGHGTQRGEVNDLTEYQKPAVCTYAEADLAQMISAQGGDVGQSGEGDGCGPAGC